MSELWMRPEYIRLTDDDGNLIFTTQFPNMAVVGRLAGTITVGGHTPDAGLNVSHEIDHYIGPNPGSGAHGFIGWARIVAGSPFINANRVFQFSESVVLDGVAFKSAGWAQIVMTLVWLTPVFAGGGISIRESYICHKQASGPAFTGPDLPEYDVEYDIRVMGWVGGF